MYSFEVPYNALQDVLSVPLHRIRLATMSLADTESAISSLEEIADISSGMYIDQYSPQGLPYLRVDNIRPFILSQEDLVYISPIQVKSKKRITVENEDVLIARTGTLGKATLATGPIVGAVISQHVTRLKCKGQVQPGYLAAFLNSEIGKYQLIYGGFGSTRLELTHQAIKAIKIPIIDNETQNEIHRRVIKALQDYNESIRLFDQAVEELEQVIMDSFQVPAPTNFFEVSEGDLTDLWTPRYYVPRYDALVRWLRENFEYKYLSDVARIERGKGTKISEYAKSGIPFVRTSSLINYGIDPFPDHYASDDLTEAFNQPTQSGDILVSIEGKVGQVAYLTKADSCVFKNHIELVRCHGSYDPMLIFLILASKIGKFQMKKQMVVQSTIPGLNDRLRDVIIPTYPRSASQVAFFEKKTQYLCQLGYEAAGLRDLAVKNMRAIQEELTSIILHMRDYQLI